MVRDYHDDYEYHNDQNHSWTSSVLGMDWWCGTKYFCSTYRDIGGWHFRVCKPNHVMVRDYHSDHDYQKTRSVWITMSALGLVCNIIFPLTVVLVMIIMIISFIRPTLMVIIIMMVTTTNHHSRSTKWVRPVTFIHFVIRIIGQSCLRLGVRAWHNRHTLSACNFLLDS
jgi:hypothetical protein